MIARFDWSRVQILAASVREGVDLARRVETIAACTARPIHCPPDAPACPSCLERGKEVAS